MPSIPVPNMPILVGNLRTRSRPTSGARFSDGYKNVVGLLPSLCAYRGHGFEATTGQYSWIFQRLALRDFLRSITSIFWYRRWASLS